MNAKLLMNAAMGLNVETPTDHTSAYAQQEPNWKTMKEPAKVNVC